MIFEAVVSCGSVQGAADAIGLTQSAVSRVVQRLEADLGHVLLDRTQRPIKPTRDGERALHHARSVLAALEQMEAEFRDNKCPAGPFHLGIPHALIGILLTEKDMLGLDKFPQLKAAITSGWSDELLTKLAQRDLDAVITIVPADAVPGHTEPIVTSTVQVVANSDNAHCAGHLLTANAIGWALNPDGCGYRKALLRALKEQGTTPNIVLETNSMELQLRFAEEGRALTLAPAFVKGMSPVTSRLHFVDATDLDASVSVLLHHSQGSHSFAPVFQEIETQARRFLE